MTVGEGGGGGNVGGGVKGGKGGGGIFGGGEQLSIAVCMLACRTRTARNRRVKDAIWSVTGPLSAASARYLRMVDSDFRAVKRK